MIEEVLDIIREEADNYLKLRLKEGHEQYVVLAPIVDHEGKPSVTDNSVCMTLVKIAKDANNMSNPVHTVRVGNQVHVSSPDIRINLYVLFSASYADGQEKNYKESLKRLSGVISFFQAKSMFSSENTPRLPPEYGNIVMEIYNEPIEEQSYLWGMHGGQYRPSVLYRLRALMVQDEQVIRTHESDRSVERDIDEK